VKGGRAPGEEASSPARFRNGGKHPDWPQSISLRGAVEAVNLGRSAARSLLLAIEWGGDSPAPASLRSGDSGARETRREGDPCLRASAFARAFSAGVVTALASLRPPLSRRHGFGHDRRAWKGPRSLSRWRIGSSFEGVPARQKRCRNRQASPGPKKRRVDPFLTEHRPAQTGSRAHVKPRSHRKGEARG
jgi:hypothetical protein